jgi:two-component system LytT family response regulator
LRSWVSGIVLLESEGNYTRLFFAKEHPLIRRSLNPIEQQLDPHTLFRANRRHILNLNSIESTARSFDGGLAGGREIELSRRRSEELRRHLSL